jgi:hypothetical protein
LTGFSAIFAISKTAGCNPATGCFAFNRNPYGETVMVAPIGQLKGKTSRTLLVYVAVVPHPDLLPNDRHLGQDVTKPGWYHVSAASGNYYGPYRTRAQCVTWARRSPVWST